MRSIKNKNMKKDLLLMSMFDFTYAGKAHVFIHYKNKQFIVTAAGVHLVDNIYTFSPNFKRSWKVKSLYDAINIFNEIVHFMTSTLDWYSPELFETDKVYEEIFKCALI